MKNKKPIFIKYDSVTIRLPMDERALRVLTTACALLGVSRNRFFELMLEDHFRKREESEAISRQIAELQYQEAIEQLKAFGDDQESVRISILQVGRSEYSRRSDLLRRSLNDPDAREQVIYELAERTRDAFTTKSSPIIQFTPNGKNEFNINFSLSHLPRENDPIQVTFDRLAGYLGLSKSAFLRWLYMRFLKSNVDLTEDGNLVKGFNYGEKLSRIENWNPYGWRSPLLENFRAVQDGSLHFWFLNGENSGFKNHRIETLVLFDNRDDPLVETIPYVCGRLGRNRSSFFQMLYMYFLKEYDFLDDRFLLRKEWANSIDTLQI